MRLYLANLWAALVAKPELMLVSEGWLVARADYLLHLEARIADFEKQAMERFTNRSAASRRAHETRKALRSSDQAVQGPSSAFPSNTDGAVGASTESEGAKPLAPQSAAQE